MSIAQPTNLFTRPFAASGDKTLIQDTGGAAQGKASLAEGFPAATQKPVAQGGIAPDRKDFNGILYMLSCFAFWAQSGGLFAWRNTLQYSVPSLVYHANALFWCVADSGPGTAAGAVEPGKNTNYWTDFYTVLVKQSSNGIPLDHASDETTYGIGTITKYGHVELVDALTETKYTDGKALSAYQGQVLAQMIKDNPAGDVGDIKMHYGTTAPAGWFACDGSSFSTTNYPKLYQKLGSSILPDFRGMFPRGYDPGGRYDKDGPKRKIGSAQGAAMKKITGQFYSSVRDNHATQGAFKEISRWSTNYRNGGGDDWGSLIDFDSSRVVDAADEVRPVNFAILFCIKHD